LEGLDAEAGMDAQAFTELSSFSTSLSSAISGCTLPDSATTGGSLVSRA
jgi:hypothetical protein